MTIDRQEIITEYHDPTSAQTFMGFALYKFSFPDPSVLGVWSIEAYYGNLVSFIYLFEKYCVMHHWTAGIFGILMMYVEIVIYIEIPRTM